MNSRSCGCGCQPMPEMYYNNIVKKCFVEEVPHVVNYNTHVVNECVKKHITIPKYTTTEETVFIDEYQNTPYQVPYQTPIMEQYPTQPIQNNVVNTPIMPNGNIFNPYQF
ncbi:MAG: hypothetical protein R3Y05_05165 [bacterium]